MIGIQALRSRFMVWGLGLRVEGGGLRVEGSGCKLWGSVCGVTLLDFRVRDSEVCAVMFRVQDLGFRGTKVVHLQTLSLNPTPCPLHPKPVQGYLPRQKLPHPLDTP